MKISVNKNNRYIVTWNDFEFETPIKLPICRFNLSCCSGDIAIVTISYYLESRHHGDVMLNELKNNGYSLAYAIEDGIGIPLLTVEYIVTRPDVLPVKQCRCVKIGKNE